jgi:hypothetical protein
MASIINSTTTNGIVVSGDNSGSLQLASNNGTTAVTIDGSQNVGIGTSSPASKLNIGANDGTAYSASSSTGQSGVGATVQLTNLATAANGVSQLLFNMNNDRVINRIVSSYTSTEDGYLAFVTEGAATPAERMRIDSSGNVGIGTNSPSSYGSVAPRLVVTGSGRADAWFVGGSSTGAYAYFSNNAQTSTTNTMQIGQGWASGTDNIGFLNTNGANPLLFATNGAERMRITSGGEVYIAGTSDQGAYNLQVNGTGVWGAGAYVNGSDERIKENISPIESGLDVVEKLNPVTYRYKEEWSKDQSTQTGFIAQELLTALDGQVYVDGIVQQGGEYMSVAYQNIIPILTKAIQELNAKVEAQAVRIAELEGAQ